MEDTKLILEKLDELRTELKSDNQKLKEELRAEYKSENKKLKEELIEVIKKEILDRMFVFEEEYGRDIKIAVEGIQSLNEKITAQNNEIARIEGRVNTLSAYQIENEREIAVLKTKVG